MLAYFLLGKNPRLADNFTMLICFGIVSSSDSIKEAFAMSKIDGFQSALEALRGLDTKSQERILADILKKDPEMAKKLKSNLIVFDDLLKVNPQGILRLFTAVPDAKWVLALRGKSPAFLEALMKPLASRKSELIKAAIAHLGPQSMTKVEANQKEIIAKALELESQGKLIFSRDSDPLV
jgi:flagellar motor switch protein FliG